MHACVICTCHSIHVETTGQLVEVRSLLSTPESWGWNSGNQVSGEHLYPLNLSAGSCFGYCKGLFFNPLFHWLASAAGADQVKDVTRILFHPALATAYGRPWEMVGFHLLSMLHREKVQKETAQDATILERHLFQGRGDVGKKEFTVFPPYEDKHAWNGRVCLSLLMTAILRFGYTTVYITLW